MPDVLAGGSKAEGAGVGSPRSAARRDRAPATADRENSGLLREAMQREEEQAEWAEGPVGAPL